MQAKLKQLIRSKLAYPYERKRGKRLVLKRALCSMARNVGAPNILALPLMS